MLNHEDNPNLLTTKRNHLPVNEDEKQQTRARAESALGKLFDSIGQIKRITYESQGHYDEQLQTVKMSTLKNLPLGFGKQNKAGIFLTLYEALFCFEAELVLILYNNVQLSLAEAYHLFLRNDRQFKEYIVFQKVTTAGFCVLPHSAITNCQHKSDEIVTPPTNMIEQTDTSPIIDPGDCNLTMEAVLDKLILYGPKEQPSDTTTCIPTVTFDLYIKDTFVRNKPRKGIPGKPDFQIVVVAEYDQPPTMVHMLNNDDKLIFAIVDDNGSVCYYNISAHDTGSQTFELWKKSITEFE